MYRVLIILFFLASSIFAQEDRAKVLAETITLKTLQKHVKTLSSDEMEGRETGAKGQKKAAVYIMQQFMKQEINPFNGSYFQRFPLMEINPKEQFISINGKPLSFLNDYLHYSNFDNCTIETKKAVFVGYGEYKTIAESKIAINKSTVFLVGHRKEGDVERLEDRIQNLQQKGAEAVFVIEEFLNPSTLYIEDKKQALALDSLPYSIPVIYIAKNFVDSVFNTTSNFSLNKWFKTSSKKQKIKSFEFAVKVNSKMVNYELSSENVFAFIPGDTKQDEIIVLMAHYDHLGKIGKEIFNGADDNASGTAAILEIAEAFNLAKEMGGGFKRSVLFLLVSGEEKGLLGSSYYCTNPLFSLQQTKAVLNVDMIGRSDTFHLDNSNYIYVIGSDFLSQDLHDINELQNSKYSNLTLDYKYNNKKDPNRFYYRSDHYNFAKLGIPSIFYFSGIHEDYHEISDTYDKIDFQKLEKISRHIFYTAWELVNYSKDILPK